MRARDMLSVTTAALLASSALLAQGTPAKPTAKKAAAPAAAVTDSGKKATTNKEMGKDSGKVKTHKASKHGHAKAKP